MIAFPHTLLLLLAQLTSLPATLGVHKGQLSPTGTLSVDIRHNRPRNALVILIRQVNVAKFTDAKIAQIVIKNPTVTHGSAYIANITDEVDSRCPLKSKSVVHRAAFLGARRFSALNTVEFLADPAK